MPPNIIHMNTASSILSTVVSGVREGGKSSNKIAEREIKKTIPFIIVPKRMKYSGLNLTKDMKDLYSKNYKTFLKEIKGDTNK